MPGEILHDKLPGNVGVWTLWAIGVGAFIGGDFVGWPSVLAGGFGSGLISVGLMSFYFWMIGRAAGDLSARFHDPGGTYMFCRRVYGVRISPFIAIMQTMKLLTSNCCMALAISSYVQQTAFKSTLLQISTWFGCYFVCTLLDIVGIKLSARVQIAVVIICLIIMVAYFMSASYSFNFRANSLGGCGWFQGGFQGFLVSLPFGMWFLDGFEELPLAVSYADDMGKTVPTAMNMSWTTAVILAICLMLFGSAATPVNELINAPAPLMPAVKLVWGSNGLITTLLDSCIILGLIISFYSFVFFIGQTVQAIAADKILPAFLAQTHKNYETAANASLFSSIIGFLATLCFGLLFGESSAQRVLIVCSLLAAVICYYFLFGCLSIIIKIENENTKKYAHSYHDPSSSSDVGYDPGSMRFPLGRAGAICGQIMSILLLLCTFNLATNHQDYRTGVILICFLCLFIVGSIFLFSLIEKHMLKFLQSTHTPKNSLSHPNCKKRNTTLPCISVKKLSRGGTSNTCNGNSIDISTSSAMSGNRLLLDHSHNGHDSTIDITTNSTTDNITTTTTTSSACKDSNASFITTTSTATTTTATTTTLYNNSNYNSIVCQTIDNNNNNESLTFQNTTKRKNSFDNNNNNNNNNNSNNNNNNSNSNNNNDNNNNHNHNNNNNSNNNNNNNNNNNSSNNNNDNNNSSNNNNGKIHDNNSTNNVDIDNNKKKNSKSSNSSHKSSGSNIGNSLKINTLINKKELHSSQKENRIAKSNNKSINPIQSKSSKDLPVLLPKPMKIERVEKRKDSTVNDNHKIEFHQIHLKTTNTSLSHIDSLLFLDNSNGNLPPLDNQIIVI